MPQSCSSQIHVVFKKCQNKPGAQIGTCEEINQLFFLGPGPWHSGSQILRRLSSLKRIGLRTDYWPKDGCTQISSTRKNIQRSCSDVHTNIFMIEQVSILIEKYSGILK